MKILVIEDDKTVGEYVRRGLDEAGYHVDLVGDGDEGLRRASGKVTGGGYDMMVLDLRLPRMSGIDVLRTLRDRGVGLPVLVLTAQDSVDFKVQALRMGADDYVTKPFAFEELLARVQALIRRSTGAAEPTRLTVGELTLDLVTRKAERGGRPLELRPREYALLEYLMRNDGRVVSKAMVLSHVFDYSFDPRTNVVDVLVHRLREKVDKGFPKPMIHTVRGMGYVLKPA